MKKEEEPWMTNRQKKLQPKQGKFWCWGCDACLVHDWKKCPVCRTRNGKRRNKK